MMLTQHSPGLLHSLLEVQLVAAAKLLELVVFVPVPPVPVPVGVDVVELLLELVVELVVELVLELVVVPPPVPVDVGAAPPNSPSSPSAQLDRPSANTHVTPAAKRNALAEAPRTRHAGWIPALRGLDQAPRPILICSLVSAPQATHSSAGHAPARARAAERSEECC